MFPDLLLGLYTADEMSQGMAEIDAGEMTDLRYDTLADTVRGLIAKLRRR